MLCNDPEYYMVQERAEKIPSWNHSMLSMTTLPLSLPDPDVSCKEATAAFIKKSSVVLWFVKASECQQLIPGQGPAPSVGKL